MLEALGVTNQVASQCGQLNKMGFYVQSDGRTSRIASHLTWLWLLFFYWFGVIFYDYLVSQFNVYFLDELFVLLLVFVYVMRFFSVLRLDKRFFYLLVIMGFYVWYSIGLGVNSFDAIVNDFFVTVKSPLAFVLLLSIRPSFSMRQLQWLMASALVGSVAVIVVLLFGDVAVELIFQHPSRLATAAILSALLYIVASLCIYRARLNLTDLTIFMGILLLSLPSGRAKAYGFFVVSLALAIYFLYAKNDNNPLSIGRTAFVASIVSVILLYVAFEKISYYFIVGSQGQELFARPALYEVSLSLAKDYFPFGSGFGSFASHYSGVFYSPLYSEYGLDNVWGLRQNAPVFVSDALIPMLLGQFGVAGVLILSLILIRLFNSFRLIACGIAGGNKYLFLCSLMFVFCLTESIADSTLVQNRGVFLLSLLSFVYVSCRSSITELGVRDGGGCIINGNRQHDHLYTHKFT